MEVNHNSLKQGYSWFKQAINEAKPIHFEILACLFATSAISKCFSFFPFYLFYGPFITISLHIGLFFVCKSWDINKKFEYSNLFVTHKDKVIFKRVKFFLLAYLIFTILNNLSYQFLASHFKLSSIMWSSFFSIVTMCIYWPFTFTPYLMANFGFNLDQALTMSFKIISENFKSLIFIVLVELSTLVVIPISLFVIKGEVANIIFLLVSGFVLLCLFLKFGPSLYYNEYLVFRELTKDLEVNK